MGAVVCAGLALAGRFFVRYWQASAFRTDRDALQLEAEKAERERHPWAGVYLAFRDPSYMDASLLIASDGRFLGATYELYSPARRSISEGHASFTEPTLAFRPQVTRGRDDGARFQGEYRLVRWGDVRCLIRPGEEGRFLQCLSSPCDKYRPLCSRGYLYGEPDIPGASAARKWKDRRLPEFLGYRQADIRKTR
jgi:hypothetical protein